MIRVVFLDIDNTLLSFSGYVKEAMRDGFHLFGLPEYEESMFAVFEKINNGLWKQLERGELTFEKLIEVRWNRIFEALGISCDGIAFEKYFREKLHNSAVPEPGAIELLEWLYSRYALCVVSNGPYEQQMNRLRVGKMDGYFTDFFISSRVGAQKPSAEFFDFCFSALREKGFDGLCPEDVMIIGDSVSADIIGGKEYGMHTCLYAPGNEKAGEPSPAEYTVKSLAEIIRVLSFQF